jgi:hypothetical protein
MEIDVFCSLARYDFPDAVCAPYLNHYLQYHLRHCCNIFSTTDLTILTNGQQSEEIVAFPVVAH